MKVHDWSEIKPLLYRAVQKIEVKSINGSSGDVCQCGCDEQHPLHCLYQDDNGCSADHFCACSA